MLTRLAQRYRYEDSDAGPSDVSDEGEEEEGGEESEEEEEEEGEGLSSPSYAFHPNTRFRAIR